MKYQTLAKLILASLFMVSAFAFPATATDTGVCEDHRDFCLANCTSSSPCTCRSQCLKDYSACKGETSNEALQPCLIGGIE
jgi:hypothetical protein